MKTLIRIGAGTLAAIALLGWRELPAIGAGALLHPARHVTGGPPPPGCANADIEGDGIMLRAWRCQAAGPARATVVYLHGVADNRGSASGVIARYIRRGFDVVAYDSRAHGESQGDACTYGFHEKADLRRVIDRVAAAPVVLVGTSLGAAVALQEAADDPRVRAVVAAETFSDLRTVATERAPAFFSKTAIARAFERAGREGRFDVDAVSPLDAARRITVPVLLLHGANDVDTPPAHSQRVFAALAGPKRLILVPGAAHNESLRGGVWPEIDAWIDQVLATAAHR